MRKKYAVLWLSLSVVALLLVAYNAQQQERSLQSFLTGNDNAVAGEAHTSKIVFGVHCYDEGRNALSGMKGILKIERGFRNFREINTVYYDPKLITIEEMEKALKSAGTYREIIQE